MALVLAFNLLLLLFRVLYVIYYPIDLSPEEAQYWDWSRHLDLSYYSKPPMVAYLNFLSTKLFGNTELAVRLTPMILSFLLSLATYFFVKRVFDRRTALVASTLPQITVGFSINSLLMTTDVPFLFFWSISVISIYYALEKNTKLHWLLVGLFSGVAFLSKYTAMFLLPLTLLWMLLSKRLRERTPYVSLLPAIVLSLPVFVWNYQHDFVSFKHVSTLASKSESFISLYDVSQFILGETLLLSFIPFLFLIYAWFKSFKSKRLLFFTVYSLPAFGFFFLLSLHKRVEANWPGFAYFSGFVLLSYFLARSRMLLPTYFLSAVLFLFLHFTPLFDKLGLRSLLPPNRDPTIILLGWKELGKEVSQLYTGKEMIFSPHYQVTAELAFYVKGQPSTFCVNLGRRMNQYDLWKEGMKNYMGKNAIFVSVGPVEDRILRAFDGIMEERIYRVFWRGQAVNTFYIYKLKNYKGLEESLPMGY
ncbi:MAG: ArnT family glycosyltransferase [Aquificaceae bacterium]